MAYHTPTEPATYILDWLKNTYVYDAKTGELRSVNKKTPVGHRASIKSYRFVSYVNKQNGIQIEKKTMLAHHVVWFLYYGVWPKQEIDHINRVRSDNRIENLREVDHKTNKINSSHCPTCTCHSA